jgi:hypothetical protein
MDARLSEHFPPEDKPAPVDLGPAPLHRLHGRIRIGPSTELRITTQPRRDRTEGARLITRLWYFRQETGSWWPAKRDPGTFVLARDARAFLAAVESAVAALEQDERQRTDEGGDSCGTSR